MLCATAECKCLPTAFFSQLQDSMVVIEQNKSGFDRPGDLEFEDYSQGINRASSDSSLGTPKGTMDILGKNRSKNFWLFSKRSKVRNNTGRTLG